MKCRRCGEDLPPKEEQDCEHYKDNLCCLCFLEEQDEDIENGLI